MYFCRPLTTTLRVISMTTVKLSSKLKVAKPKTTRAKRPRATTSDGHYVTNDYLMPLIIAAKADNNTLSPKLAEALMLIVQRFSFSSNFVGYSFREDMVSFALVNLCANWHKYNEIDYANPFAYYTQAAYHSFLQFLASEQKQRDRRDRLLIAMGANPSYGYTDRHSTSGVRTSDETAFRAPRMED